VVHLDRPLAGERCADDLPHARGLLAEAAAASQAALPTSGIAAKDHRGHHANVDCVDGHT
jgi:hypothetical protein